ncbi:hypothetical protein F6X40_35345 [Paraburkholderia sp. UCT31]|uniref:hypothetical protein n=1 Tax=Paraburkholderia sp. UCT31 TaxID=2615209 RepID=UPI0016561607|nr:hypothetical protein [Paraburkholderia sp. UCT31]MBC8741826.1 hypothetical protein [Paraburkholderia sp. UCT31]
MSRTLNLAVAALVLVSVNTAFAYSGWKVAPENTVLPSKELTGYVGEVGFHVIYPKINDPVVRKYVKERLMECGPSMPREDEDPDEDSPTSCELEITAFRSGKHFVTLQTLSSKEELSRIHYWADAQVFVLSGKEHRMLKKSDILSPTDKCRHQIGESLLREAAADEDQASWTVGVSAEQLFDRMNIWAVDSNRVEFIEPGFTGANSYLQLSNQQLGDCLRLR